MFNHFSTFAVTIIVLYASISGISANYVSGVSWVFQGTTQQNNTVLTFNMYDTLNLMCKATGEDYPRTYFAFAITKGNSAPTMMSSNYVNSYYSLTVDNAGTMIWNDYDGIQAGFENFIIYSDGLPYSNVNMYAVHAIRYVNIATLMTADSGTYHCSVMCYEGDNTDYFGTSGALTIQVNTKDGQAHSSRSKVSNILTFYVFIIGASKFIL